MLQCHGSSIALTDTRADGCRHAPAHPRMCVRLTTWDFLLMATAIPGASIGSGRMEVHSSSPAAAASFLASLVFHWRKVKCYSQHAAPSMHDLHFNIAGVLVAPCEGGACNSCKRRCFSVW